MAGISSVQLAPDQRDGTRRLLDGSDQPAPHTHVVIIPSYNSGAKLLETVIEARRHWAPVWVVIDGSTDEPRSG